MSEIKLYNDDCFNIFPQIADKSVDLICCDLPYGTTSNKWDSVLPLDKLWTEYERIIKDNGGIVLTASQPFTSLLVTSNLKLFKHEWIWIKNKGSNFANTIREPFKEHEEVLFFSKGKWTYNKQMQSRTGGGADRSKYNVTFNSNSTNYRDFDIRPNNTISELRVPSSWQKFNTEVGFHPTQKPVALLEYLIKTYTNEGMLVLDPCMGSGTCGIACKKLKRNFIGIEKEKQYFDIAEKRINNTIIENTLFDI